MLSAALVRSLLLNRTISSMRLQTNWMNLMLLLCIASNPWFTTEQSSANLPSHICSASYTLSSRLSLATMPRKDVWWDSRCTFSRSISFLPSFSCTTALCTDRMTSSEMQRWLRHEISSLCSSGRLFAHSWWHLGCQNLWLRRVQMCFKPRLIQTRPTLHSLCYSRLEERQFEWLLWSYHLQSRYFCQFGLLQGAALFQHLRSTALPRLSLEVCSCQLWALTCSIFGSIHVLQSRSPTPQTRKSSPVPKFWPTSEHFK